MPPKVHFHKRREKYVLYFPYSIYFEFEVNLVARVFLALTRIYFLFSKFSYCESVLSHPSATHKIYQNISIFLSTLIAWHRNYNTIWIIFSFSNPELFWLFLWIFWSRPCDVLLFEISENCWNVRIEYLFLFLYSYLRNLNCIYIFS